MNKKIIQWILILLLSVSSLGFLVIFFSDYTAEAFMARATPLALILGLTAIGVSIIYKD